MSIQSEMTRITNNVANAYAALATLGADIPSKQTSDNLLATIGTTKAVLYTEQTLTEEQKAQVRENIGITGSSNNNVGQKTEQGGEIFNDYENNQATNQYAHAEGNETTAEGECSHAEGCDTHAIGASSHAQGYSTFAEGNCSHAEGCSTQALGNYSHAEGYGTFVDANAAHTSGYYTQAGYDNQFVCGQCNENKENTLFEVGNGNKEPYYEDAGYYQDRTITYVGGWVYCDGYPMYVYNAQNDIYSQVDEQGFDEGRFQEDYDTFYIKIPAENKNAFEVYRDGHAEVQRMGTTDNSVVVRKSVIPKRVQSFEEFEDLEQIYALPNGHIYKYKQEEVVPGVPTFTNRARTAADPFDQTKLLNGVGYKHDIKYGFDWNTGTFVEQTFKPTNYLPGYAIGIIRVTNNDIVRIKHIGFATNGTVDFITLVRPSDAPGIGCEGLNQNKLSKITTGGGHYTLIGSNETASLQDVEIHVNSATFGWVVDDSITDYYLVFYSTITVAPEDLIITVNEEITFTENTIITGWTPINKYQDSPEYLHRIISNLELRILNLEAALEKLS